MECKTCHFLETRKFRCRDTEDLEPVGEWVDWEENGHKNPYPDWCPRNNRVLQIGSEKELDKIKDIVKKTCRDY